MDPLSIPGLILALVFRAAVIQPFSMQASSMAPTLEVEDYVLASKYAYGYSQFSLPMGAHLPPFQLLKTSARRGDVVFFALPGDPATTYIKRVIGIEGDRVQIRDGITYLNNIALQRVLIGPYKGRSNSIAALGAKEYAETLPDGKTYRILDIDNAPGDNTEVFTVPPDHYFVLGDNRDNSRDSRFSVGFVPDANLIAKAFITIDYSGGRLIAHQIK